MALSGEDIGMRVAAFIDSHPSGWIKHDNLVTFLESKCSLKDICTAVPKITDPDLIEKTLVFFENIVGFEDIASCLVSEDFAPFLRAAACSPSERLRSVVVRAFDSVKRQSFPTEADADLLVTLLADEDTGVSQRVSKLFIKWVSATIYAENEKTQFISRLLGLYRARQASGGMDATNEFRYITLFIEISKQGPAIFTNIEKSGVFESIIVNFLANSADLLVKLGSLTLIESLSGFDSGREYLAHSNVLGTLETELFGPLADSTTQISILYSMACIIPFTHNEDHIRSILISPLSRFGQVISKFIISVNNPERMCAMKVLAQISTAADKNEIIDSFMRQQWRNLSQIIFALADIDVEVVNTALDALHTMIKRWEGNPFMESVTAQNQLVKEINSTFTRHPFPECRSLVYSLVGALIMYEEISDSALELILSDPSPLRHALLDHRSESDYASRSAKCDFVRVLVKREEKRLLERFFKKEEIENFIDFAEKGLQWVPISTSKDELATEAG